MNVLNHLRGLRSTMLLVAVVSWSWTSLFADEVFGPWQNEAGKACFEDWINEVEQRLNRHAGSEEFNAHKPWKINHFGVLEPSPEHQTALGYPPGDFGNYHNNRYWYMWDHYHYDQWHPEAGWSMPEWNAAGVPPLRGYVLSCLREAGAEGPTAKVSLHSYLEPKIGAYRLDWCLHHANQCGKPAADRFCRTQGFVGARSWLKATNISHVTPTYIIGDDRVCDLPGCDGFAMIACQREERAHKQRAVEPNIARWGADYLRLNTAGPEDCQAECDSERRCRAWSYVKPNYYDAKAHCWLKHSVPRPMPDACCISGVKPS